MTDSIRSIDKGRGFSWVPAAGDAGHIPVRPTIVGLACLTLVVGAGALIARSLQPQANSRDAARSAQVAVAHGTERRSLKETGPDASSYARSMPDEAKAATVRLLNPGTADLGAESADDGATRDAGGIAVAQRAPSRRMYSEARVSEPTRGMKDYSSLRAYVLGR
jgi:hypothetical protein